jgi:hypothetical protein
MFVEQMKGVSPMERTMYIVCGRYFEDEPAHNVAVFASEEMAKSLVEFLGNDALLTDSSAKYWYEAVPCYGI